MKRVMSERMQQLLRDPEAARKLREVLRFNDAPGVKQLHKMTFKNAAGQPVEVTPRFVNVG